MKTPSKRRVVMVALEALIALAFVFAVLGTFSKLAGAQSANYRPGYPSTAWVKECATSEQVIGDNVHTCRAYIHGLINALAIWQVVSPQTAQICIPRDADFGKMRDQIMPQVRKEARDNISTSQLLFQILAEQFPCRRKQPPREVAS
jgi:hypothetical protein